ncbi:hypothetical protein DY000_02019234 [Brassica cretica]|uniref:Uncharacterized protein n=1 Tax=Brassica cretica TaxID=69181 RepID=A0ABQ7DDQ7_BRACR|nr:hypothetical protein DY000_02019234 [Brassica cretica]
MTPERADFEPDPAPPPFGRGGNSSASKEARDPDSDIDSPGESEFHFLGGGVDLRKGVRFFLAMGYSPTSETRANAGVEGEGFSAKPTFQML